MVTKIILYIMMGCQMAAWAWFSYNGGTLSTRNFLIFSIGLMVGQSGTAIENWLHKSYGSVVMQLYFFTFTLVGAVNRLSQ